MKVLLTADQVAEILNISVSKAYAMMASGEIPTIKIGRCVRVREEDLEAYINEQIASQ
jgi:excisionase family DNA binding protein